MTYLKKSQYKTSKIQTNGLITSQLTYQKWGITFEFNY